MPSSRDINRLIIHILIYIHMLTSCLFPFGVGRDHILPHTSILTHTFRFHCHQIPHTRSVTLGRYRFRVPLTWLFSKTSPIWSRNVRPGLPLYLFSNHYTCRTSNHKCSLTKTIGYHVKESIKFFLS
jgi:hypothetical protein